MWCCVVNCFIHLCHCMCFWLYVHICSLIGQLLFHKALCRTCTGGGHVACPQPRLDENLKFLKVDVELGLLQLV